MQNKGQTVEFTATETKKKNSEMACSSTLKPKIWKRLQEDPRDDLETGQTSAHPNFLRSSRHVQSSWSGAVSINGSDR